MVAVDRSDESNAGDIWVYDIERSTGTRLTAAPIDESFPIWSRDGRRITFGSILADGGYAVHERSARGGDDEQVLLTRPDQSLIPRSWMADGSLLLSVGTAEQFFKQLGIYSPTSRDVAPYLTTSFSKRNPNASADGRFVAYDSDETSRSEVYIQTFPDPGERWRVSTDGGFSAVWGPDDRELYYLDARSNIVAVPVTITGASVVPGTPHELFHAELKEGSNTMYDTVDGQVFVVIRRIGAIDTTPLTITVSAFESRVRSPES